MVGRWHLRRRVLDRLAGRRGCAVGTLTVRPEGASLGWLEVGCFTWDGQRFEMSRSLRLRQHEGDWWMEFQDGRLFHPWRPGAIVEHPCAEDLYTGLIDVRAERMSTLWDVTGPAKSQRLLTRYRRIV